jgi:cytidine deaminase
MLTEQERQQLVDAAVEARAAAYAPYSEYAVGAALLTEDGTLYQGANIENAAYPVSICAERVAIFKAVNAGHRNFKGIAVVTRDGGSPCGSCRQVMAEFGLQPSVLIANTAGEVVMEGSVGDILPGAFTPANLMD